MPFRDWIDDGDANKLDDWIIDDADGLYKVDNWRLSSLSPGTLDLVWTCLAFGAMLIVFAGAGVWLAWYTH